MSLSHKGPQTKVKMTKLRMFGRRYSGGKKLLNFWSS